MSAIGIASSLLLAVARAQPHGGESCPGVRWTAPVEWRSPEGGAMYLSKPAIAPVRGGTLWLGPLLTIRRGPKEFLWPLVPRGDTMVTRLTQIPIGVVIGRDGSLRYVGMPSDQWPWIATSRVATDDRGIAHVMWLPSNSSGSRQLLYARFDGERWSVPQVVATQQFFWNPASVSQLLVTTDTLRLVANTADGLLYVEGLDNHWATRPVDIREAGVTGGYPSLTILPGGRLVLLAQGPAPDTPVWKKPGLQLTSRLFATWSDDDGVTWAPVRPVSSLPAEPAFDVHLVHGGDGVLRALWYQMTDTLGNPAENVSLGGSPGRVQIAESRDGGVSWRQYAPSELLNFAESLDAQSLDDSTIVVVLADRTAEQVLVTTWSKGWRPFARIDARPNPQQTILGRDDAQRLVLTWGSERSSPRWFLSMVSTLTPCR